MRTSNFYSISKKKLDLVVIKHKMEMKKLTLILPINEITLVLLKITNDSLGLMRMQNEIREIQALKSICVYRNAEAHFAAVPFHFYRYVFYVSFFLSEYNYDFIALYV